ncbi:DUF1127 domain-containing protein [Ferrovibrio sp.]|uniref:DUF1127 domain-containing protein n=1 Tax=Ferrovibrio sp. TaxID=1917215 RepID=UPI0025C02158|nr:DUF1127 domain-containing protein [Ferrovibrio sp.]MBX3453063.1 DUF1127 domain-containing protein [Ferrovibrio sp.]
MAECIDTIGRSEYLGPAERLGSTLGRAIDKSLAALAGMASTIVYGLLAWQRRAEERAVLAGLSERQLKDIGLSRGDIAAESGKPFWVR